MEEPGSINSEQIAEIARLLGSNSPDEQAEAERMLAQLGPRGLDLLLAILRQEQAKWEQRNGLYWPLMLVWSVTMFVMPELSGYTWKKFLTLTIFFGTSLINQLRLYTTPLHRRAARLLAQQEDVCAIGPLIDAYTISTKEIEPMLARLLPRLQASDAHLLNAKQRAWLYSQMKRRGIQWTSVPTSEFALAILKALEQVGTPEAIPHVEKLAAQTRDRYLQRAAEECLLYLREKGTERQTAQTLLRASAPQPKPGELLRPVQSQINAATQGPELLRASLTDTTHSVSQYSFSTHKERPAKDTTNIAVQGE